MLARSGRCTQLSYLKGQENVCVCVRVLPLAPLLLSRYPGWCRVPRTQTFRLNRCSHQFQRSYYARKSCERVFTAMRGGGGGSESRYLHITSSAALASRTRQHLNVCLFQQTKVRKRKRVFHFLL